MAPTIAMIGAGRVGRAVGRLLHQRGWRIGAVVARSPKSARAAVRAIGAGKPSVRGDCAALAADIVLIVTPDTAIASVAEELAASCSERDLAGKVVLHTCGVLDRNVLRPLERRGAATGSWHPLQTFGRGGPPRLKGCACAIEGSPRAMRWARRLCRELGCVAIEVPRGSKPAYHAAAALAAGHILGIVEAATRIFVAVGFSRRQAVRALLPLTRQTLANFESRGGPPSWTGPASRGDLETIARHLEALRRFPREYRAAYTAVTRLSALVLAHDPLGALRRLDPVLRGRARRAARC